MHDACMTLWGELLTPLRKLIPGCSVLEVGSYNVNGSIRTHFEGRSIYIGVDWRPGPCVDVVSLAHKMDFDRQFDFVCSASMLEHDPHWRESIKRMVELVKPEGYLLLSWGAAENPHHNPETAPDGGFHSIPAYLMLRELESLGLYIHRFLYEQDIHTGYVPGGVGLVASRIPPEEEPRISPLREADQEPAPKLKGQRVALGIAAYVGPRGFYDPHCDYEPWIYLRLQFEALRRLRNRLDRIMVVVNSDKPLPPFCSGLLPEEINDAPVTFDVRPNRGMSYGALRWALEHGALEYDTLIWTEDDYLFGQHDFDSFLAKRLAKKPTTGLVCGKWMPETNTAAMFAGAFSTKALRQIMPLPDLPEGYGACVAQHDIPAALARAGWQVEDWLDEWATAYRTGHGNDLTLEWFGPRDKPSFMMPIQAIGKSAVIAGQDHVGVLGWDGVLR